MSKAEQSDDILQAVIISDSYNDRLKPLTIDTPRCLLPLANKPLIEYTLQFLATSSVKQVFIFLCNHAEAIKEYITSSQWSSPSSPFEVHFIPAPDSLSAGDALRELDAKQLITSDFILLTGDIVSNIALDDIVHEHRERRKANKDSIMTMVLRESNPTHTARSVIDSAIFCLNRQNQCLAYLPIDPAEPTRKIQLDLDILFKHADIEFRNDLIDCTLDICSPDVPALFTENFDYEALRGDFVNGVLTSDLLGKTIHASIVTDGYCARVEGVGTYVSITRDLIRRWAYPFIPTGIQGNNIIDAKSTIDGSVRDSVIGPECRIAGTSQIMNSQLWSHVDIGEGSRVEGSILADHVKIGMNCIINEDCILGPGVQISNDTTIPQNTKLFLSDEHDFELVGTEGKGRRYIAEADDSDSDDAKVDASIGYRLSQLNFSTESVSTITSEQSYTHIRTGSSALSQISEDPDSNFYTLAKNDLENAIAEGNSVDDTMLELTSLRMRENVGMHEVRIAMLDALFSEIERLISLGGQVSVVTSRVVTRWSALLKRTISPSTLEEDCLDILHSLASCAKARLELFVPMLKFLYDADVLMEDEIVKWFEGAPKDATRDKAAAFVQWLQEAEEEDEESD